jgi:hypothetical protein
MPAGVPCTHQLLVTLTVQTIKSNPHPGADHPIGKPSDDSPPRGRHPQRRSTPVVRHRGKFCYVDAVLPGNREPTPILRLRYQGSPDRWAIAIYLASHDRYTESELPTSFGPKTGTPEQGIDHTFILYAGPGTHR